MTLLDDLQAAVVSQVDAYETPPDHLTVESEDDDLVATGSWHELVESGLGLTDETDDPIRLPTRNTHAVSLDGALAQRVRAAFAQFHESVAAPGAALDSPTLIQLDAETGPFSETFISTFDTNLAFFSELQGQTTSHPPRAVRESLCETDLQELDPDVTADQLQDLQFVYSDIEASYLMNVRGEVATPHPHRYFDVDSLEDYREAAAEYPDLDADGPPYTVQFIARRSEGDLASDVIDFAESRIQTVGENALDTACDYMLEAEHLAYSDDTVEEFTVFVYVPVN